ncbi:putative chitinase 10 [Haematobia irritans]|uniref:putative chitinase 10 n=1 Tax=Haematobia irritans TaxID=7368 RepID=UPI003F4FC83D
MIILQFLFIMSIFANANTLVTDKMINCYFGSWANDNRRYQYEFIPATIPPLCTHISYAFFGINHLGVIDDSHTKVGENANWINSIIGLKSKDRKLKILAVVGGDQVSSSHFSRIAKHSLTRSIFVETAIEFLEQKGFDGMDLHWLLPGSSGVAEDKSNFVGLVREFKKSFTANKLQFGISVTGNFTYAEKWYDVPNIAKHVDFINVMTYNYTNDKRNVYPSPLYGTEYSVEKSIDFWLTNGTPESKVIMGLALFARVYTIQDNSLLAVPNMGICALKNNATLEFNEDRATNVIRHPWGTASFESIDTIAIKMDYVQMMNLGGVMVWSLENDDFNAMCGRKYPLLATIARKLDERYVCRHLPGRFPIIHDIIFIFQKMTTKLLDVLLIICIVPRVFVKAAKNEKMVNCYLGSWSYDRPSEENLNAEAISIGLCTHLSYAFIGLTDAGALDIQKFKNDKEIDWLKRTVGMKKYKRNLKVIAVIRGDSYIFSDPQKHSIFKDSVLAFLKKYGFDGIDLYWVYSDTDKDTETAYTDKRNFVLLLRDLQEAMDPLNLQLGVSVSGSVSTAHAWHDVPRLFKFVHYVNVLVYNYTDGTKAAHTAPFSGTDDNNVQMDIHYWLKSGNYDKINIGVALIGRMFKLKEKRHNEPGSEIATGRENPYLPYYEICKLVQDYNRTFDDHAGASYAYLDDNWITYEDAHSLALKLDMIMEKQLRGIAVWSVENDDYRAQCGEQFHLLQFIRRYFSRWYYRVGSLSCKSYGEKRAYCYKEY